jgi:hypothetical protein
MLGQADRDSVLILRGMDNADARHRYRRGMKVFWFFAPGPRFSKKNRQRFFLKKEAKISIPGLKRLLRPGCQNAAR